MRYPLAYAHSRSFPRATLPDAVQTFYVVTMTWANALLAQFFPNVGPGSDFSVVPFDIEYVGRKHSDRVMRTLGIPLPWDSSHYLRLLTIARDGVVITFDLLALGAIPPRVIEIFRNPFIIKVGVDIKSDSILLLRHFAVAVYNGWELSQLWKCMHPSIEAAPLTSHISLDDMARIVLGVSLDKDMQTSDWSLTLLDAFLDAYIVVLIFAVVREEYESRAWTTFAPSAFSFNADIVDNGAVIVPGPATTGTSIHVWGIGNAVPLNASQDWSPAHSILDGYNSSPYSDCRSTSLRRFFGREWDNLSMVIWRAYVFSTYRVSRWTYVHAVRLVFGIIVVVVSIVVSFFFD